MYCLSLLSNYLLPWVLIALTCWLFVLVFSSSTALSCPLIWWATFRVSMWSALMTFTELQYVHVHTVCWTYGRCIATYIHVGTAIFLYEWFMWDSLRLTPDISEHESLLGQSLFLPQIKLYIIHTVRWLRSTLVLCIHVPQVLPSLF